METISAEHILEVIRAEVGSIEGSFEESDIDSLEFLSLCQAIEKEFNIRLSDEALSKVTSVEELIALVQSSH